MVTQGSKACQLLGLATDTVMPFWRWGRRTILPFALTLPNTLPDGILGVIVTQGFEPDKPLLPRRANGQIFPGHDLVALLFQIVHEMLKEEGSGNAGVHIPADLTVPGGLALLLGLPGVIAHGAALLRLFNDRQAMLPAKVIRSAPHESIGGLAIVILFAVLEGDRVQHKVVM